MAVTVTIDLTASLAKAGRSRSRRAVRCPLRKSDVAWLKTRLRRVCGYLGFSCGVWAVQIVSDAEMKVLHQRFLGCKTTTDVITFDMRAAATKAQPDRLELDTAICVDEAERQSGLRQVSIRSEVLLYAVHSLLHVSGYDDRTPAMARRMHQREDEILSDLGVGPVYQSVQRSVRSCHL
jgi:probable rRNA maturation factor